MPRILVVDDESEMTVVLQKFFTRYGFEVSIAFNGANALAILASGIKIDLLVLDMRMPVMRGITLLQEMADRDIKLPVIILTGSLNFSGFVETAEALGYSQNDIMFKPVNLEALLKQVTRKLKIRKADLVKKQKTPAGKKKNNSSAINGVVIEKIDGKK